MGREWRIDEEGERDNGGSADGAEAEWGGASAHQAEDEE